jgi:hypothetical protein
LNIIATNIGVGTREALNVAVPRSVSEGSTSRVIVADRKALGEIRDSADISFRTSREIIATHDEVI